MNDPAWLVEALRYVGVKEIPGKRHHPKILEWWKKIRRGGIKSDEVPWCAAFTGAMLENVGIVSSRFESAKSYLDWGIPLRTPVRGCIAVFTRTGGGHVGFVLADDGNGRILVVGGNQGDAVTIAPFEKSRVVSYRWPKAVPVPTQPLPVIGSTQKSSTNEA